MNAWDRLAPVHSFDVADYCRRCAALSSDCECGDACGDDGARESSAPVQKIWTLSSSSDPRALAVVDGIGEFRDHGPHYSRRTPGSKTFTGVGQEIVLVTACGRAVWACVRQKTPMRRGTGQSRGRAGETDSRARFIWRNMMFRNLGAGLSSALIESATETTYREWFRRYGVLPEERLRTEVDVRRIRSRNPGFCYQMAGWEKGRIVRGKLYLYAPDFDRAAFERQSEIA